jgi:hypothetical protein
MELAPASNLGLLFPASGALGVLVIMDLDAIHRGKLQP